MSKQYVYWISIDPIRRKIDPYPKFISQKLEKEYNNRDLFTITSYALGNDFFNATIHFHYDGTIYQTTPGLSLGRAGFKQPGYRSVKRIIVNENQNKVTVYSKKVHDEWRLARSEDDSEYTFNDPILKENFVNNEETIIDYSIDYWKSHDLQSTNLTKNVIIWEWCRGTTENNGNLMLLSNDWWNPYLFYQNQKIETSFANKEKETTIILPNESSERNIQFIPNNGYGIQLRYESNIQYSRLIRRRVITIGELQEKIKNINKLPLDPLVLETILDSDQIPNEFYCSISQSIMYDPVKTIDGHTYDRRSIEKWFQINNTSPLTGLHLSSTILEPNIELKQQIEKFTKEKLES
jgi:hypothetical protein